MGIAVSFVSGKGGTGKSTAVAGIASCLAAMGRRVLCIDCDAGLRNLDILLGMAEQANTSYMDVINGAAGLEDAPRHSRINSLFLLTAPFRQNTSPEVIAGFEALVANAKQIFDYVLLDSPAGIGSGFKMASKFADRGIVVSTCDMPSLRGGDRAEIALRELGIKENSLIVNRVKPKQLAKTAYTIDTAIDTVGLRLLGIIPEDNSVPLAAAKGIPLTLWRKTGAAEALVNISKRMEGIKTPLMKL